MTKVERRSGPGIGWWMGAAVGGSVVLSAAALVMFGRHQRGIDTALILTGRWAFLLFWPAYAGSGVAALFGERWGFLKRYGREFGLAFATAMVVHVGLIVWLCLSDAPPAVGVFLFFGPGLVCIYTLALFSVGGLQRRLGRRSWWVMRTAAMNYLAVAFASDFLVHPFGGGLKHVVLYAPFALLVVAGFVCHGASWGLLRVRQLKFE